MWLFLPDSWPSTSTAPIGGRAVALMPSEVWRFPADHPWRVVALPLPDAVPWWVRQLHEGGGGVRNTDEGRKGARCISFHPCRGVAVWPFIPVPSVPAAPIRGRVVALMPSEVSRFPADHPWRWGLYLCRMPCRGFRNAEGGQCVPAILGHGVPSDVVAGGVRLSLSAFLPWSMRQLHEGGGGGRKGGAVHSLPSVPRCGRVALHSGVRGSTSTGCRAVVGVSAS